MIIDALQKRKVSGTSGLALLIDPDKASPEHLDELLMIAASNKPDYLFTGGSLLTTGRFEETLTRLKSASDIPVVIFPGSLNQISFTADAFLLLSLISGRNPELLIGEHVKAAPILRAGNIETWATGYMLIDGGKSTTASYISNSAPIPADKPEIAVSTAMAGEMLGLKVIYLDAGSGALTPVSAEMISAVKESVDLPVIVGGGINTPEKARSAAEAGANLIVVGNAPEQSPEVLREISQAIPEFSSN